MDYVKVVTKECIYVGWARGMRGVKSDGFLVLGTGPTSVPSMGCVDINIPADAIEDVQVIAGDSVITKQLDIDYYFVSLPPL